jgi:hypothetical protein
MFPQVHDSKHVFLTSALDGGEWSASRAGCFTPGVRARDTHSVEGWVWSRTGLDALESKKKDPIIASAGNFVQPVSKFLY